MTLEHCMIDTETFGVGNSAGLVQIGAVAFDLDQASSPLWTAAEWTVSLQSSLLLGGEVDSSTVAFWRKAPLEARASIQALETGTMVSVGRALRELTGFFIANGCRYVWCHGASFDAPILGGYYARAESATPWKYSNIRDTRTIFHLAEDLAGWIRPQAPVAHTGLADARAQTRDLVTAYTALKAALKEVQQS